MNADLIFWSCLILSNSDFSLSDHSITDTEKWLGF